MNLEDIPNIVWYPFRYNIDGDLVIRFWWEHEAEPFLIQPNYPNGSSFENADAAQTWANSYALFLDDLKVQKEEADSLRAELEANSTTE